MRFVKFNCSSIIVVVVVGGGVVELKGLVLLRNKIVNLLFLVDLLNHFTHTQMIAEYKRRLQSTIGVGNEGELRSKPFV